MLRREISTRLLSGMFTPDTIAMLSSYLDSRSPFSRDMLCGNDAEKLLSLTLLVLGIFADYQNPAMSPDDAALGASDLDRCRYFHTIAFLADDSLALRGQFGVHFVRLRGSAFRQLCHVARVKMPCRAVRTESGRLRDSPILVI